MSSGTDRRGNFVHQLASYELQQYLLSRIVDSFGKNIALLYRTLLIQQTDMS